MKTLIASLMVTAFAASPAFACAFGKTAEMKKPHLSAQAPVKPEQAISTFDPATKPIFEDKAEAVEENAPIKKPVVDE